MNREIILLILAAAVPIQCTAERLRYGNAKTGILVTSERFSEILRLAVGEEIRSASGGGVTIGQLSSIPTVEGLTGDPDWTFVSKTGEIFEALGLEPIALGSRAFMNSLNCSDLIQNLRREGAQVRELGNELHLGDGEERAYRVTMVRTLSERSHHGIYVFTWAKDRWISGRLFLITYSDGGIVQLEEFHHFEICSPRNPKERVAPSASWIEV